MFVRLAGWFLAWTLVPCTAFAEDAPPPADRPAPAAIVPVTPTEAISPDARQTTRDAAPPPDFVSTRNVEDKLEEARRSRVALFDFGARDASLRFERRLYDATRIRVAGIYTVLSQHATDGDGPRSATGGDVDIIATWDAVKRGDKIVGALDVALEGRHKYWTKIPPASLSQTIDSLWTTTSGFNVQTFFPVQIYWRQSWQGGRWRMRIGKLSPYATFFGNRINSSSLFFVNYGFADVPAVFMPGNGVGVHVSHDLSKHWTVHVGIQNANGLKTRIEPSTLRFGEFWYAVQVDYKSKIRGLGEGTWRLGGWYVNGREVAKTKDGFGTVLSIDQELGKRVIGFLRYEFQGQSLLSPEIRRDALTATEWALRAGFGFPGPFRRLPDDFLGIGAAWGSPSRIPVRDSFVGEIFYRFQLESSAQLSVSAQAIRSSTVFREVFVFSFRLRVEF